MYILCLVCSEILLDERQREIEQMKLDNRRVQTLAWGECTIHLLMLGAYVHELTYIYSTGLVFFQMAHHCVHYILIYFISVSDDMGSDDDFQAPPKVSTKGSNNVFESVI